LPVTLGLRSKSKSGAPVGYDRRFDAGALLDVILRTHWFAGIAAHLLGQSAGCILVSAPLIPVDPEQRLRLNRVGERRHNFGAHGVVT